MVSQHPSFSSIVIDDVTIHRDAEGRYCLNDLHKASGGAVKNRPATWLQNQQTIDLAKECEIDGIPSIFAKQGLGTFVVKELVYAYAMWISPSFHLKVIRTFDAVVTGTLQPVNSALPYQPAMKIQIFELAMRALRVSETSKIRMLAKLSESEGINPDFLPDYVDEPLVRAITPLLKEMRSPLFHHVAKTVNPALEAMGILEHLSRKSTGNTIKWFWSLTEEGLKYGRNETSPNNPRETQPLFFVERFPELLARLEAYINPQSLPL
ncbi:KilA-N domain-containing protein [Chromatium okenii]|uniref:DNA-binding protein n=1 Tax=Chromatium okenii TaxID=61644 RepID=A0A2S7XQR8_9GAMM|nr:KilA-N domain-containing protein [Chromatium okenii]PQJ96070.1 DNA-binding protein [Chromatium okenii]